METYTQSTVTSNLTQLIQESDAVAQYLQPGSDLGMDLYLGAVTLSPVEDFISLCFNKRGTETVEWNTWNSSVTTKIRITDVDVVYWGDHPLETLVEDAIEEGELDEDYKEGDIPEELVNQADGCLLDFIEDGFEELTGVRGEVITKPVSFGCYGGWVATVRLPQTVSVTDTKGGVKARLVAA